MPKPAAAICWKVAPLIHRDRAFCSFSRAWSWAGRDERSRAGAATVNDLCGQVLTSDYRSGSRVANRVAEVLERARAFGGCFSEQERDPQIHKRGGAM